MHTLERWERVFNLLHYWTLLKINTTVKNVNECHCYPYPVASAHSNSSNNDCILILSFFFGLGISLQIGLTLAGIFYKNKKDKCL